MENGGRQNEQNIIWDPRPRMSHCSACGVQTHVPGLHCFLCFFRIQLHYAYANPLDPTSLLVALPGGRRPEGLARSASSGSETDFSTDTSEDSSLDDSSIDASPPHPKKLKFDELQAELSKIIGLDNLKEQLETWAKGMQMDLQRRFLGIQVGSSAPPHFVFLGNPGTGKTTIARMMGKVLYGMGMLSSAKVVEVQRTDLVDNFIGGTGPKTKNKIAEARGGILFVDEAYRLIVPSSNSESDKDYGLEALEEIMSVMEKGKLSVIFAGYKEPMQRVLASNEGLRRRITTIFPFDDYTCEQLARILQLKLSQQGHKLCGFKLEASCSIDVVAGLIEKMTTEDVRSMMNAGLVDQMLTKAKENLDKRLNANCTDKDLLFTLTFQDLEAALVWVNKTNQSVFKEVETEDYVVIGTI